MTTMGITSTFDIIHEYAESHHVGFQQMTDTSVRLYRLFGQYITLNSFTITMSDEQGRRVNIASDSDSYITLTFNPVSKQQTLILANLIIDHLSRPDLVFLSEGLRDIWIEANSRTYLCVRPTDVDADRIAHGIVISAQFASMVFMGFYHVTSLTIREGVRGLDVSDTNEPGRVLHNSLSTEAINRIQILSDNEARDNRYAPMVSQQDADNNTRTAFDSMSKKNISVEDAMLYATATARLEMTDVIATNTSLTFTTSHQDTISVVVGSQHAPYGKHSNHTVAPVVTVTIPGCDEPLGLQYPQDIRELIDFFVTLYQLPNVAILPLRLEAIQRMAGDAGLNVAAEANVCNHSLVVEGLVPMQPGTTSGWLFRYTVDQGYTVNRHNRRHAALTTYFDSPEDTMDENEWLSLAELTIDQLRR